MARRRTLQDIDIAELERLLQQKKHAMRPARRQRMKASGRLVEGPALAPPLPPRRISANGNAARAGLPVTILSSQQSPEQGGLRRWSFGRALLVVELCAVVLFVMVIVQLWRTNSTLNRALAEVQRAEGAALALPTPRATAVIDVAILPGGHRYPHAGEAPQPGEAGYIPAHLLPAINSYESPPAPTPAPAHARRIQIEAIDVDSAIYQGMYDWEVLKKGVAQHIGSAAPGQVGNMILAGHNDVYGEVFRDLDQLAPGDEIRVSSERQVYVYVVRETRIVEPTDVSVMGSTGYASLTLISCYPYRVNTKRIVVFADLAG